MICVYAGGVGSLHVSAMEATRLSSTSRRSTDKSTFWFMCLRPNEGRCRQLSRHTEDHLSSCLRSTRR